MEKAAELGLIQPVPKVVELQVAQPLAAREEESVLEHRTGPAIHNRGRAHRIVEVRPPESIIFILLENTAGAVGQKRAVAPRIIVMKRLFAGEGIVAPHDLVHAIAVHIYASRSPCIFAFLKQIPAVVMKVSRRIRVNIA